MALWKKIGQSVNSFKKIYTSSHSEHYRFNKVNISRYIHVTPGRRLILSPQEVTDILRENEFTADIDEGPVKYYETNQVASNNPIEDYTTEVKCNLTTGYLFGVFDGHGGRSCANITSRRLFQYVAATMLPKDELHYYATSDQCPPLIHHFDENKAKIQFIPYLSNIYVKSFNNFLRNLDIYKNDKDHSLENLLEYTFQYLDRDLSLEVLENLQPDNKTDKRLLEIAVTGAVACVAYIEDNHLYIANTGDSCAVMGSISEDNWTCKKLCNEHTVENVLERKRLLQLHPNEEETVIRNDRLLGELLPLRAFGDYRYKWNIEHFDKHITPVLGKVVPQNYLTPPYLTAKPEIFKYRLTPKDKFVVLATDGLWDMLTPNEVVSLVGEHMLGKVAFTPVQFQNKIINLNEVMEVLEKRQESLENKPIDRNAATHLIRHAFGTTDSGIISNSQLAKLFSMPPKLARRYRDDISLTVIYFNEEYLRKQVHSE